MELKLGQSSSFSKTITETDVYNFAGICGDFNPVHVNKIIAEKSIFKKNIVHGALIASFLSTVIGMQLPGPGTIYLEQDSKFVKPTFIGDTITAEVSVNEILNQNKGIYKLLTQVKNQHGETVLDGYAIVKYH